MTETRMPCGAKDGDGGPLATLDLRGSRTDTTPRRMQMRAVEGETDETTRKPPRQPQQQLMTEAYAGEGVRRYRRI